MKLVRESGMFTYPLSASKLQLLVSS